MEKLIQEFVNYQEPCCKEEVLSTGYPELDSLTGGLRRGDLFVIASRPSIGKTSFALNIVRNMALAPKNPSCILFFSIEETKEQITKRFLCLEAGVNETKFENLNKKDMTRISAVISRLADAKIFIDPAGGLPTDMLREKCLSFHQKHKIDIIVIDYLQLIRHKSQANIQQQFSEIIQELKQLACELDLPVVVLVQLNRELSETTEIPHVGLFQEAGVVVEFADVIVLLHRERKEGINKRVFAIVAQAPNGKNGVVTMQYNPENQQFKIADTCEKL